MTLTKLQKLLKASEGLDSGQIDLLVEMANALKQVIESKINPDSDVLTAHFTSVFSNRLKLYHATHAEKFKKKTFEYAFQQASIAAGRVATINPDSTYPGSDIVVDGVSFSLKTEAAKSINKHRIKISKFMEARWIRDCKSKRAFAKAIKTQIIPHLSNYERILVLRAFDTSDGRVKYDLIEVPKAILMQMEKLKEKDFSPRTKNGSTVAFVKKGKETVFKLRLDGSVEKVTIEQLLVKRCIFHGSWLIPN